MMLNWARLCERYLATTYRHNILYIYISYDVSHMIYKLYVKYIAQNHKRNHGQFELQCHPNIIGEG